MTVSTTAPAVPQLHTRRPSGLPSWPLVLVEGPEKTGKSWLCALFTASEHVGRAVWLDWVEGEGDHYSSIPGVDYELVDHNGTFEGIAREIHAARAEAQQRLDRGEKPLLLVIDSMTAEWEALKVWANDRACSTESARAKLARNPGADIPVPMNVWNDVHERHYRIMRMLMTFPGIVVMTARGKEVAAVGDDGKPTGERDYRVEAHKHLAYDATGWIRLSRTHPPQIIGARAVTSGGRPGQDETRTIRDLSLDWFTFDHLLDGHTTAGQTRTLPGAPPILSQPSGVAAENATMAAPAIDWEAWRRTASGDPDRLRDLWHLARYHQAGQATVDAIAADGIAATHNHSPATPADEHNEAEIADPVGDSELCSGSRQAPDSGMTLEDTDSGHLHGLCPACLTWNSVTEAGTLDEHAPAAALQHT